MLKFSFFFAFVLGSLISTAQVCPILPTPAVYQTTNGQFVCSGTLLIDPSEITPNLKAAFTDYALWANNIRFTLCPKPDGAV